MLRLLVAVSVYDIMPHTASESGRHHGPAFEQRMKIPIAENIHLDNLLGCAPGITPAANKGHDRFAAQTRDHFSENKEAR
ncbi:hypothetical protein [Oleiharenicola lentus]|uniref:hypothetical protein n=1 Tax=Oleiharenicola lentus TaxID=2508720 RepID=UPI003F66FFA2